MKKSIIKNLIALTFALGALVFVAGNVFGQVNDNPFGQPSGPSEVTEAAGQESSGGTVTKICATKTKGHQYAFVRGCGKILPPNAGGTLYCCGSWMWGRQIDIGNGGQYVTCFVDHPLCQ